jgi:hypothetical protein
MQLHKEGVMTTGSGFGRRILRILVESAALYSLIHLLYAVLYEAQNQVEITPSFLVSFELQSIIFPSQQGSSQQEASVASITCSLIIVRTEKASHHPQSFSTSGGSDTMITPGKSLADSKYTGNQDGKPEVFALHSMEINVDVSKAVMNDEASRRV